MELLTACALKQEGAVIVPVFTDAFPVALPACFQEILYAAHHAELFTGQYGTVFASPVVENGKLDFVIFQGMGPSNQLNPRLVFNAMFGAFFKAAAFHPSSVQVLLNSPVFLNYDYCEKTAEAAVLSQYSNGQQKTNYKDTSFASVTLVSDAPFIEKAAEEGFVCGSNTNLSRRMIDASSEELSPASFAAAAKKAAAQCGFECVSFGREETAAMGMNAFLAVSRGSSKEPILTVMRYLGAPENPQKVALVGKGVTFDSGGYNMKSNCTGMNTDMGGAAAVFGAVKTAAQMKLPVNVIGIVAACENMVSANSFLPGEVIRSMNGKTIEIENTDCEGRLTLCDAITYAVRKEGVTSIIDIATLTGSVLQATGNETAGMISSSDPLAALLMEASAASAEKIWRLPIDHDLMYAYDSSVADCKNMATQAKVGAGSSMAGMFLEDFTEGLPWAHLDIACSEWNRHIANASKVGSSGYGARLLYFTLKKMFHCA